MYGSRWRLESIAFYARKHGGGGKGFFLFFFVKSYPQTSFAGEREARYLREDLNLDFHPKVGRYIGTCIRRICLIAISCTDRSDNVDYVPSIGRRKRKCLVGGISEKICICQNSPGSGFNFYIG